MTAMLDDGEKAMYVYIVQRTQIYLSEAETTALDREAGRTGQSRSQLIRRAINDAYLTPGSDVDAMLRALEETAGTWKGRDITGEAYVDAIRPGMGRRMAKLWPDRPGSDAPADR